MSDSSSAPPESDFYFIRFILEGVGQLALAEVQASYAIDQPAPLKLVSASSQYDTGKFWSAYALNDGAEETCYAAQDPESQIEAVTFLYKGEITDTLSVQKLELFISDNIYAIDPIHMNVQGT